MDKITSNIDSKNNTSSVWGDSLQKYELENILDIKVPRIVVKKMEENVEIEDTYVFKFLLWYFNKAHW